MSLKDKNWEAIIGAGIVAGNLQYTALNSQHLQTGFVITGAILAGLAAALSVAYPSTRKSADPVSVEGLPPGVDATGPEDDVPHDVVTKVVSSVLPPMVSAAAPELAGNISKEIGRVLKRGIRL